MLSWFAWSRLKSRFGTILVLLGVFFVLAGTVHYVFNPRNLERYSEMELRLATVRQMNREVELHNLRLIQEIEACRHDPRYLYRAARHELKMVRGEDEVYLFPAAPALSRTP